MAEIIDKAWFEKKHTNKLVATVEIKDVAYDVHDACAEEAILELQKQISEIDAENIKVNNGEKETTVQDWLDELEGKVGSLSEVDADYLKQLEELIKEVKTGEGSGLDTLIDKLKGIEYATVKEYVEAVQTSLKEYVNSKISDEVVIPDGIVLSVNGVEPDEDGNVELELGNLEIEEGKTLSEALEDKVDATTLSTESLDLMTASYDEGSKTIKFGSTSKEVVKMA